ncbi:MAG: hypothetical protein HY067_08160 [Betaproteobacteria bacterium]|nr:hypothetical protein [Betaproteobacteria bacterium]
MKRNNLVAVLAAVWAILASPVSLADTSLGLRVGTLGGGVELAHAFTEKLGFRVSVNGLNYNTSETHESVDYDAKLKLESGQLLLDWFPFSNNFRLSAGAMYNGNKFTLDGKPSAGGTFTINGTTYSSSNVGSLNGKFDFRKAAPYVGLGYGRPIGKGLSLAADLGVLFQGSPRSTLSATCGAATPAGLCSQIQGDVAAEQDKLDDDMHKYRYYPVVSIGLAYVF